jgi:hypothetical protein
MTKRDELERGLHRFGADVVLRTRSRSRLFDGLARKDAEGDRDRERCGELGEGSRHRVSQNVEMRGLASDQAAKRHDRIETPRPCEQSDGRGQLEGARHLEFLDLCAFRKRGLQGAPGERPGDLVVPARTHDRDPRAGVWILSPRRSLPSTRHLPQSSPRMHCRLVAG